MNHVCRYTCLNEKKKNPLPSLTSAMCRQIRMNLNQSNHSHLKVGEKKLLCRMTKLISQGGGGGLGTDPLRRVGVNHSAEICNKAQIKIT